MNSNVNLYKSKCEEQWNTIEQIINKNNRIKKKKKNNKKIINKK